MPPSHGILFSKDEIAKPSRSEIGSPHSRLVLKGALDTGTSGVNVLLYGSPNTGKTQFCKALAEKLGVSLFSGGESDEEGDELARGEKLQELRLAQRLLSGDC